MKALVIQTALKQTAKAQSCLAPLLSTPTPSQGKVSPSGLLGIFQALTEHIHTHVYIYIHVQNTNGLNLDALLGDLFALCTIPWQHTQMHLSFGKSTWC